MCSFNDYFFPKNCLHCGKEGKWLCQSCESGLFFMDAHFCPFCGRRDDMFAVCSRCAKRTGIEKVFSLFKYSNPLARKIIKNFKYNYLIDVLSDLEALLRRFLLKYNTILEYNNAILLPVPLSMFKFAERGFNQAEELAKIIGKIMNLQIAPDIVKKVRRTRNQVEIDMLERTQNLIGAFQVIKAPPKNILIVDDVCTTGSTVCEVAGILRAAGAEKIQVITLARG